MTNPGIEPGPQVPQTCVLTTAPICPSSTGLEPVASGAENQRSIQLSYEDYKSIFGIEPKDFLDN